VQALVRAEPPRRATAPAAAIRTPYNGCGLTPAWGLNTYYGYGVDGFDAATLLAAAQTMLDTGLWQAGYRMIAIDDGWASLDRDADGNLVADPDKFPDGIGATVDRLHAMGFSVGIYGDMGTQTCQGRPGSYQSEERDAQWFAAQGLDYIKMDWCTAEAFDAQERYTLMSQAITATGRPITFAVCNWGRQNPWEWAPPIANSARTTSDLSGIYDGDVLDQQYGSYQWSCMLKNIDGNQHPEVAGPGFANDPDCLQVGNGFFETETEAIAQLQLWAVMGAPMLLGLDVRTIDDGTVRLLTHSMLQAVNRDAFARQGVRVSSEHGAEVWVKPLSDQRSYAVVLFNRTDSTSTAALNWQSLWSVSSAYVRDLWSWSELGMQRDGWSTRLQPHESRFLQITPQP
jgi:alpha-galactosidase